MKKTQEVLSKEVVSKMHRIELLEAYNDLTALSAKPYFHIQPLRSSDCCTCRNCTACKNCIDCEKCSECKTCIVCTDLKCCHSCSACMVCTKCTNCKDCFLCVSLAGKKFHVLNVEFTEDEYNAIITKVAYPERDLRDRIQRCVLKIKKLFPKN